MEKKAGREGGARILKRMRDGGKRTVIAEVLSLESRPREISVGGIQRGSALNEIQDDNPGGSEKKLDRGTFIRDTGI